MASQEELKKIRDEIKLLREALQGFASKTEVKTLVSDEIKVQNETLTSDVDVDLFNG